MREIYESPALRANLVFKGGTSLSKVFRIISRFSEDIDLSLSPGFLGFDEAALEEASTRTQRDRNQKRVEKLCEAAIRKQIAPAIQQAITSQLVEQSSRSWRIEAIVDETTHSPVVLFHYPVAVAYDAYVRPEVKIEFGSLTDQQPTGSHTVRSILADEFPDEFTERDGVVVALEVERTFWEKATILHAEYHRPREQELRARFSRHYSDFAALVTHPVSAPAIKRTDVLARVARHKSRFFASGWAHYNEAVPGSFHVVPPEHRLREIENDYAKMADMFFETPSPFASVMNALVDAERRINETR